MPRPVLVRQQPQLRLDHRQDLRHHRGDDARLVVVVLRRRLLRRLVHGGRAHLPRGTGVGVWGHRSPVNWGWPIVNFVFWIGIGHAGTLISAILCLLRQKWRTSINRAAEAMTIFAVVCAGIFPVFHVGRVWFAWFLFPAPELQLHLAELPLAAGVGRVRGLDLRHGLGAVLVRRHDPGPRRCCATASPPPARRLRAWLYGLFAMGWRGSNRALEQLRDGLPDPGRHRDAARALGAHHRVLRLRRLADPRLAHDDLPAVLRRRARSSRASAWC